MRSWEGSFFGPSAKAVALKIRSPRIKLQRVLPAQFQDFNLTGGLARNFWRDLLRERGRPLSSRKGKAVCPKCGRILGDEAVRGICTRCLFFQGMGKMAEKQHCEDQANWPAQPFLRRARREKPQ